MGEEIAGFCTISYDDTTRSAVIVLDGTGAEHRYKGLGVAQVTEARGYAQVDLLVDEQVGVSGKVRLKTMERPT